MTLRSIRAKALTIAGARDDAVDSDVPSSDFSKRLQQMGIADPSPNYSPSSTASQTIPSNDGPSQPLGPAFPPLRQNNTLSVLEARRTLEQQAEENLEEVGRTGRGRKFIDTRTLIDAMQLRSRGAADADIEERLRLHPGLLDKLGTQSMLSLVSPGGK